MNYFVDYFKQAELALAAYAKSLATKSLRRCIGRLSRPCMA